ncbi:hypothetical protein LINPERPRIM_LOCUS31851 [Linum perenne]
MEEYQRRCVCGAEVVLLTSWTEENPGRRFFRCGNMKKGLGNGTRHYFAWLDKPMPFRAKVVINGLRRKMDTYEQADGDSSFADEIDSKPSHVVVKESKKSDTHNPFLILVVIVLGIVIGKFL